VSNAVGPGQGRTPSRSRHVRACGAAAA